MGLRSYLRDTEDSNPNAVSWNGSTVVGGGAAAGAPNAAGVQSGLAAAGQLLPGSAGLAATGAASGVGLGTLLGVSSPVGAAIGGGLALISGLLGSAAKRKRERAMADAGREEAQGKTIVAASNARSTALKGLIR